MKRKLNYDENIYIYASMELYLRKISPHKLKFCGTDPQEDTSLFKTMSDGYLLCSYLSYYLLLFATNSFIKPLFPVTLVFFYRGNIIKKKCIIYTQAPTFLIFTVFSIQILKIFIGITIADNLSEVHVLFHFCLNNFDRHGYNQEWPLPVW